MDKEIYTVMSCCIFRNLRIKTLSLAALIDVVTPYLPKHLSRPAVVNYLFWVKLDLEARGIVQPVASRHYKHVQCFKLARKWMHRDHTSLIEELESAS
jgi:hypothetical protein